MSSFGLFTTHLLLYGVSGSAMMTYQSLKTVYDLSKWTYTAFSFGSKLLFKEIPKKEVSAIVLLTKEEKDSLEETFVVVDYL